MNAANRVLRGDDRIGPDPGGRRAVGRDELEPESVRVYQPDGLLSETSRYLEYPKLVLRQPVPPEVERSSRYRQGDDAHFSAAHPAAEGARPGEEGHQTPGLTDLVAEVEVVGAGIVEIHRPLHQPQPEEPRVEIEIALGISRDRGDVVNALCSVSHMSS